MTPQAGTDNSEPPVSGRMVVKMKIKKELPYLLLILPAFITYTVLTFIPLAMTFGLSLSNWNGSVIKDLKFAGLTNYLSAFSDVRMTTALKNTLFYAVMNPICVTLLAIPLALALNSRMPTRNFQRAAFFFPSVPSILILGYLWSYIMSPMEFGILNKFFGLFGMDAIPWLSSPKMAIWSVLIVSVWSMVGWHACIYIAQMQGISSDFYEAASIDGASKAQQFFRITLPLLRPAVASSTLLLLTSALKVYELPYALTKGGPGSATTMLTQIVIQTVFINKKYGAATAMSIIFCAIVAAIGFIQYKVTHKKEV